LPDAHLLARRTRPASSARATRVEFSSETGEAGPGRPRPSPRAPDPGTGSFRRSACLTRSRRAGYAGGYTELKEFVRPVRQAQADVPSTRTSRRRCSCPQGEAALTHLGLDEPLCRRKGPAALHASTVLNSNTGFEDSGEIFGDEVMAAADNSYRMRQHSELRRRTVLQSPNPTALTRWHGSERRSRRTEGRSAWSAWPDSTVR
jgi:hypothetical protein